jgi:hypothetical protein
VAAAKPKGCPFSRTQFVLDDSLRAVFALGSDRSRTRDVDVGLIKEPLRNINSAVLYSLNSSTSYRYGKVTLNTKLPAPLERLPDGFSLASTRFGSPSLTKVWTSTNAIRR